MASNSQPTDLRHTPEKISLLFVCLGNICRSPAAEGIMQHLVDEAGLTNRFVIDSAGIGGWHVGDLPDKRMRRCGKAHGYDFCSRARQLQAEDFNRFDYIIVMDSDNYRQASSLARNSRQQEKIRMMADYLTAHPMYTYIPDPYYGGEKDFELVIELLEDACRGMMEELRILNDEF